MGEWADKLASKTSSVTSAASGAKKFYTQHRGLLERYKGGAPVGFLSAIAYTESSGRMVAGDASLGEFGFFQITSDFPGTVGVSPEIRKTPEGNIFLACLEYAIAAQRIANQNPEISPGSVDQWLLARMVFALGGAGTRKLIQGAGSARYENIVKYVDRAMPDTKTWYRTRLVALTWKVGTLVAPYQTVGAPEKIPAPAGVTYVLPKGVSLPSPLPLGLLIVGAGAALLLIK